MSLPFLTIDQSLTMTRINIIPPEELCDQHLLAEHRELTRIPNDIAKRQGKVPLSKAPGYHLGTGHVTFFRDKLRFLKDRYDALHRECLQRGFKVHYKWPDDVAEYVHLWNDYEVTAQDRAINMARIIERIPEKPRYTPYQTGQSDIESSTIETINRRNHRSIEP